MRLQPFYVDNFTGNDSDNIHILQSNNNLDQLNLVMWQNLAPRFLNYAAIANNFYLTLLPN